VELQQESKAANAPVRDKVQSNDRYISAQHTSEEIEELVLSDTIQSNVPLKNAWSVARFYGLNQAILSACIADTASERVFIASSEQI